VTLAVINDVQFSNLCSSVSYRYCKQARRHRRKKDVNPIIDERIQANLLLCRVTVMSHDALGRSGYKGANSKRT
jgi:hypothetical protein